MEKSINRLPLGAFLSILLSTGAFCGTCAAADDIQNQAPPATASISDVRARSIAATKLALARFTKDADVPAAKAAFQNAAKIDSSYGVPWYYLGRLAEMQENWTEAISNYEQVGKLDQVSDYYVKSQLHLDTVRKLAELDKTLEGKQRRKFEAVITSAKNAIAAGKTAEAMSFAQQAALIDPSRYEAPAFQGTVLAQLQQWSFAETFLKKAAIIAPADKQPALRAIISQCETAIDFSRVQLELGRKHFSQAANDFERIANSANDKELFLSAAAAHVLAGNTYRAGEILRELSSDSNPTIAAEASKKLAALEPLLQASESEFQIASQSAEAGNVDGVYQLGLCYALGQGTTQDKLAAYRSFEKAAALGDPAAEFNLGVMSAAGEGTSRDLKAAFDHFKIAADSGIHQAEFVVGCALADGAGTPKNDVEAVQWIQQASAGGVQSATEWLAAHNRTTKEPSKK